MAMLCLCLHIHTDNDVNVTSHYYGDNDDCCYCSLLHNPLKCSQKKNGHRILIWNLCQYMVMANERVYSPSASSLSSSLFVICHLQLNVTLQSVVIFGLLQFNVLFCVVCMSLLVNQLLRFACWFECILRHLYRKSKIFPHYVKLTFSAYKVHCTVEWNEEFFDI